MNIVRNTITEGTETYRERSRIGSINHRIWSVIAPMLFIAFGLFGVNVEAWGAYVNQQYTCTGYSYSKPANTGYTWITLKGTSFNGSFSQDVSDNSGYNEKHSGWGSAPSTYDVTATMYANPKEDYKFIGWYSNEAGTGTALSTSTNNNCYYSTTVKANKGNGNPARNFYAIFAKFKPSTTEINFGDVAYNSGTYTEKFTIDCHNVGTWSNPSGLSSMLSASLSNNKDDNTQHTCTVTVTLNTTTAGTYNQTLNVTTSRGGTINVTVKAKVTATPSYTWNTNVWNANGTMKKDVYVGDTLTDVVSTPSNGTKTYSISGFTASSTINAGASTPTFTNNTLYCTQAGTLTLHINQAAETNGFEAGSSSVSIIIKKRPNTLYANSSENYAPTMYTDKNLAVTLTATNTDYSGSPISVEQVNAADTTIAKYEYSQASHSGTVTSRQFLASTSWHMTQPENYKYLAGENTFSVTVANASEATNCYIVTNESDQIEKTVGNWLEDTPGKTINLDSRGSSLTFQARKSRNDAISQLFAQATKNGNDWYDLNSEALDLGTSNNTYGPYDVKDVKSIRFCVKSGGSYTKYIDHICVTRKTYLNVGTDNSSINGTLTINKKDGGSAIYPGEKGQQSTTVYWGIANGGNLKIKCDDPRFTFSQNTITGVDCNSRTTDITVYYKDSVAGTVTATATVYNDVYNRTFTVKGVIEKADQSITWHNDILRLGQSYTDVATANTLVTYESEDESIIRVDEDDEGHKTILTAVGTGTVNITATAEETSFYAEKSSTKGIKVTEKQIQWIDWNQSLFGLKLGGANVTMNAVAASDVEGCASSRLIEYSSNNDTVVKVVNNNQLQIIGVGTAIITAVQAGGFDTDGHDYERAETEKTVIVRDPNASCESFAYQQGQEVKMDCGWNALDKQTRTSEINFNGIIPATGTLRYKGEYRKVAINYFDGTMTVEQYIPGENWQPVKGGDLGKPSIGTYQTANLTFDRRATKMRVKVTDGLGYHYFTDCQVTQARFIETTELVDFNLNVGQQQNQVIYLSYSNITDGLSLTLAQGANSHFSVDKSFIEGSCGGHAKNVALTITYHPTAEETNAQDVLTITDGTTSCQVVLTGSATRVNRHINWDHVDETDIYTVQTETLSAEARTDLNELAGVVTFSLASSSTATGAISMENVLSFTSAGVANVVAYTKDDARYNAAPNVTKVFNVSKTPTTISTLPVLEAVTSGTAVGDVELTGWQVTNTVNGGVVDGTLAITSADLINVGTNTVTLSFTPSNTDMYVGCTSTTTIVVNKATSVATPSAANIVYGQKVNDSELSNEGTAGTWSWTDEKAEDVLAAGTYNDLAVHFTPSSDNYTELDATVTLTIEKANPEVTAQASAITYGQTISASELSTATGNISGTWAWAVDEEQVLSVGNHALKANFTSTNANYSDLSNVDVTLKVNKIEKLEVPVALSFCAGGEVNFHGNTYSEAGEYQVEAEGATRDTVYDVTVTKLQPTTGTDSKTITVGANESWNGIDLSGYAIGSHEVVFHTENAAGCDSTVTLTLTVVPATNIFTNATENGDWDDPANWQSGIVPTGDPNIFVTGDLVIDEDITVGNLTIESTGSVAVISGGTLTVNGTSEDRTEYGDVHVMSDGALALGNAANLQVRDFTLDAALGNSSNAATSGQVSGDVNLHINRDAYFQMSFDPSGAIDYGWYDFTVPFEVEVLNGVYDSLMNKLTNGPDYVVMNFNEARRASSGKGWGSFAGTMQPGRIYSIGFDDERTWNTFIFKKKSGSTLLSNGSFTAECSNSGAADDRGWNGLGNGTLQHRELTELGSRKVQVYNHSEDNYTTYDADEKAYAVGTAFFLQADEYLSSISLTATDGSKALRAPKYGVRELDEFRLTLTAEGDDRYADRMWVSASEEATGEYVIGHDLLKMGTPKDAKVAQMWTVNNDLRLCDIEMPLMDDKAQCPISFFAPQAQTYEIAVDQAPEDATLYLTYNDRIIWSLSASPYTIDLTKGMTEGYGLRIVARHNAPSVATGMDELNVDQDGNRKVLIDNMLYIITPEGAMYSVTGEKVK